MFFFGEERKNAKLAIFANTFLKYQLAGMSQNEEKEVDYFLLAIIAFVMNVLHRHCQHCALFRGF